jgi:acetylornithine/N-succinyldiaminopimelate aminotransferase
VFCCNSGAEAVESAIKFIRRYHDKTGNPDRYRLIVSQGGFHGRTLAALSAGSNPKVQEGYAPLVDGFDVVSFNDVQALKNAISPQTAGILLEAVQGEGGVRPHSAEFIQAARTLCDQHGLLLFLDEVQCGSGRTGRFFAYEHYGVQPDITTLGKGIGSGFPLAATLVTNQVAATMTPGCHGSTCGSNPLAMAVGNAVLDLMLEPGFMPQVQQTGEMLKHALQQLQQRFPDKIREVRGLGLMLGIETTGSAYHMAEELRKNGLLVAPAGDSVLRIVPPLIIEKEHIDEAIWLFEKVLPLG